MSPDAQLAFASIAEIAALFRKRKLSPLELTRFLLQRISTLNPKLNAYLTVSADLALRQAKQAEAELFGRAGKKRDRGPLHGIPISLKDNIYTAGVRTTAGSQILRNFIPEQDANVVSQLREAGAVLLGKTNLHEFAYGVTSNNPHFGPVRNPWDTQRIPGGSSGGSAAALAAGLCYGSIGTDTGGSIRIPAALCGVVGLKPSLGRVSVGGTIPLSPTLDCVGPLARCATDVALLASPIFNRQKGQLPLHRAAKVSRSKKKFRLGVPREFLSSDISPEIASAFAGATRSLERAGVRLIDMSIPLLPETEDAGNQIAWPEATHYHQQSGWFPAKADQYSEDVRGRLEQGVKVPATVYLQALETRDLFIREFHQALEEHHLDAVISPTTPIPAPLIGEETTSINGHNRPTRALLLRFNRPANLAGIPAISVPCSLTPQGLPAAIQFIAAIHAESTLLQLAATFETLHPPLPHPADF